jgi:hypothetical protein
MIETENMQLTKALLEPMPLQLQRRVGAVKGLQRVDRWYPQNARTMTQFKIRDELERGGLLCTSGHQRIRERMVIVDKAVMHMIKVDTW